MRDDGGPLAMPQYCVGAMWCGRFATNLSLSIKGPAVSDVPRSRAEANNLMAEYIALGASQGFGRKHLFHPEP